MNNIISETIAADIVSLLEGVVQTSNSERLDLHDLNVLRLLGVNIGNMLRLLQKNHIYL